MPSYFFHIGIDLHDESKAEHANTLLAPVSRTESSRLEALQGSTLTHNDLVRATPDTPDRNDWRYSKIFVQSIDMLATRPDQTAHIHPRSSSDIHVSHSGSATKARFEPAISGNEELGWGVVRLYRDALETEGLYEEEAIHRDGEHKRHHVSTHTSKALPKDDECTTLCILAVPSYMTPSDLLGFMGEKTREQVSHFRMVRTERSNRYMVLMKFRDGASAKKWRRDWNGKVFNDMEPETCQVVLVKSVILNPGRRETAFPDLTNDPFTSTAVPSRLESKAPATSSLGAKPVPPPTPALVELPTCPVCLERMDESTGLLTILCQHVFHCSCLEKWKGSGCPVCRYTQSGPSLHHPFDTEDTSRINECSICRSDTNLWICLICGNVGCGRYDSAHAIMHYKQSDHGLAMDMTTQRIWDYAADRYVHHIMQSTLDGKILDLPSHNSQQDQDHWDEKEDDVSRQKFDAMTREYTHLLTSQLDSQRQYFESQLEAAADKASRAVSAATIAETNLQTTKSALNTLQGQHATMTGETVPALEKERARLATRASKFESMARDLESSFREEKTVSSSLMDRITHLEALRKQDSETLTTLKAEIEELKEMNRDLTFFVSGQEKLKSLELGDEIEGGTVSLPAVKGAAETPDGKGTKRKSKGKGKKKVEGGLIEPGTPVAKAGPSDDNDRDEHEKHQSNEQ